MIEPYQGRVYDPCCGSGGMFVQSLKFIQRHQGNVNNLSIYGLSLGEPYIKHLDKEIWELRPIRDRILFASLYNNKFILLSIFMKQTQKTPKNEIEKAKKFLDDYRKRSEKNE